MSTTTTAVTATAQDQALKARHRAMWALGDYAAVASDLIRPLGTRLVDAVAIDAGAHVLDVAAGTGNVAIPAARRGARVVATDLTPELLDRGRRAAEAEGLELTWREADAEALPCDDGEYDAVVSCVGAMFAPHHQAVADELVRVTRPGGTIGLVSWTPEGFIGLLVSLTSGLVPGEARSRRPGCRSHIGCPRWSCGSHLACVARASRGLGEAQEGNAQL